jgi:broad specificity phosphatase PhoE
MLTLFYSPHSTSVDNEARRASGHADVPLSVRGRQQAHELGQQYATEALDAVFCSDLQRASSTAEIAFSARALPLVLDARVRECDYGALTQCSVAQIDDEFPRHIAEPFPKGESVLMVARRVGAFLRDVVRDYDGQTLVVIRHRATYWALQYWCGDASLDEVVRAPRDWREIPIWRFEVHAGDLERRSAARAVL